MNAINSWPGWLQFLTGIAVYLCWSRWYMRAPFTALLTLWLLLAYDLIEDIMDRSAAWIIAVDVLLLVLVTLWLRRAWRDRKRRKLLQKLGYKARALRAKLVKTMKDLRQPRRVLRPAPMPV